MSRGKSCGLRRYRCKSCGRTFGALTGTALSGLHRKERWLSFAASLAEGETDETFALESRKGERNLNRRPRRRGARHSRESVTRSAGERVRGVVHIQTVNSRHSQIKGFLRRFRGIATKHLDSYLRWFYLVVLGRHPSPRACLAAASARTCLRFAIEPSSIASLMLGRCTRCYAKRPLRAC